MGPRPGPWPGRAPRWSSSTSTATAAERVAAEIAAAGGSAWPWPADLSEEAQVAAMVTSTIDRFGRLDVLHNNAALTDPTS